MDSHSAYVALSRHRTGVDLHYGRDDFKDQSKLVRALSRERAKDMAQDYAKADPARAYAERRGINFGDRAREALANAREIARQAPAKARDIFAGFKPTVKRASIEPPEVSRTTDTRRAVESYARALAELERMRVQELPVLRHQQEALARARACLCTPRPHPPPSIRAADDALHPPR